MSMLMGHPFATSGLEGPGFQRQHEGGGGGRNPEGELFPDFPLRAS